MKPVKGYLKKKEAAMIPSLAGSIDSVIQTVNDLNKVKNTVFEEVDAKISEMDSAVEDASSKLDGKIQQVDETVARAEVAISAAVDEVVRQVKVIQKGEPGKNADPVDTEQIIRFVLSKIPEPQKIDEKELIQKVIRAIPENKASLKIIQEKFEADPMSVIDKIMAMPAGKFKLKSENIDGLEQTISAFRSQLSRGYLHGGGLSIVSHDTTLTGDGTPKNPLSVVGGGGSGTVTSVSVVPANGFTGTVATPSTTPAITIATSVTGVLKGNGTAISAAVANTDYQSPITLTTTGSSGASTFNGTTLNIPQYASGGTPGGLNAQIQYNNLGSFGGITGATTDGTSVSLSAAHLLNPTINGAGTGLSTLVYPNTSTSVITTIPAVTDTLVGKTTTDVLTNKDLTSGTNTFPIFNQNTTGSSAKWTVSRLLAGNSVDGSANVPFANKFIVQGTSDSGLSGAQFLGALATGLLKNTTTTGVLSAAAAGTDYQIPISLTTTGSSGAATFNTGTGAFNIPNYSSGSGGITRSVFVISTATGMGSTASVDYVYFVSGTTTTTLPTAVGNTNRYTVKNTGAGVVTVATTSAQTIDGSASIALGSSPANQSRDFVSDGSNWQII